MRARCRGARYRGVRSGRRYSTRVAGAGRQRRQRRRGPRSWPRQGAGPPAPRRAPRRRRSGVPRSHNHSHGRRGTPVAARRARALILGPVAGVRARTAAAGSPPCASRGSAPARRPCRQRKRRSQHVAAACLTCALGRTPACQHPSGCMQCYSPSTHTNRIISHIAGTQLQPFLPPSPTHLHASPRPTPPPPHCSALMAGSATSQSRALPSWRQPRGARCTSLTCTRVRRRAVQTLRRVRFSS